MRVGGRGIAPGKKAVVHRMATADDEKLQLSLKKLGVNNSSGIEEVTKEPRNSDPLEQPRDQASLAANTSTMTGHAETEPLTDTLPGIFNQPVQTV